MASFNPCYESSYKSQLLQSASDWDSNLSNGAWNYSTAAINLPSTTTSQSVVIPNKTTGSSDEDDWEPAISDFTNRNNNPCVNIAASFNSLSEQEEWTLDDGENQSISPQISKNHQFFTCDENIEEGFVSEENSSPNQPKSSGQEELFYDDSSYMDTSENYFEEGIQEYTIEHEMPTTFRKKPVKRDWCGNPVFQDDWRLGIVSSVGFSKSSFSFNSGDDCVVFKKRFVY